ncbi:MAG: flippase-like domain-containing protein, partial [Chloroflexota bacterium]|nr:flippase-like domain-containing protein [Chloroflexota bacterium]
MSIPPTDEVEPRARPAWSGQALHVGLRALLWLLVGGIAVHLLLPMVEQLPRTLAALDSADIWWLAVALLVWTPSYLFAAEAQRGAVNAPLPVVPTIVVQLAAAFASPLTPGGAGGFAINVRYLERKGVSRAAALGAVALSRVAGGVVHLIALFAVLALLGISGPGTLRVPKEELVLIGAVLVLVVLGLALGSPLGRRYV